MDLNDLKARALLYFSYFTIKDIKTLDLVFSDDVCLRDWENSAQGKPDVLKVYEKIFASVDMIAVTPTYLYEDGNTVIAELIISIDGKERILVTDILKFNTEGRISSVKAYKG